MAAAFAPSGDRLAYARGSALSVTTPRGRVVSRRSLSAVPAQMAWGPRGSALAYVTGNELHLVAGGDTVLVRAPAALELGGWLPDGAALVVSTTGDGSTADGPETYLVSTSGTVVRDLGAGAHAVPSPDGTRVAVVTRSSGSAAEIQVIALASGARTTIFTAPAQLSPAALIPALAWSPDSRQVAFLWDIDVEPDLLAQNADGSSTGLFGREHGALPTEIGMLGPLRWTKRGIDGEAFGGNGGSFIAFYNTRTGKERGVGVDLYTHAFLAASADGAQTVYNAIGPSEGTPAIGGLRIVGWNGTNDHPFLPCVGTAHGERISASAEPTTIKAGGGNDIIFARNHERDVIDCGPGNDTAFVERGDVVRRCEHVHRTRRRTDE